MAGTDHLQFQVALETDEEQRLGLWCLMYMLGAAPEVEEAFLNEENRDAARDFADTVDAEMDEAD